MVRQATTTATTAFTTYIAWYLSKNSRRCWNHSTCVTPSWVIIVGSIGLLLWLLLLISGSKKCGRQRRTGNKEQNQRGFSSPMR